MWGYLLKRILLMVPTLFGIILTTFVVLQLVPGGPVERMLSQLRAPERGGEAGAVSLGGTGREGLADLREEQRAYLNKLYGFDRPLPEQFFGWVRRLSTFDFGESYYRHQTVVGLVWEKLPVSLSLGGWSFLLVYATCIPLGISKARRHGSTFDSLSSVVVLLGYSIPGFALGIFLIVLLGGGSFLSWFPLRGLTSDGFNQLSVAGKIGDYFWHLALPLTCYVIGSFSVMTLLTKNSFLEQISGMYVQVARAKGASEPRVFWRHVFRNAMIPIVLGFPGNFLAVFFGSSLLIETLFTLDGLGLLSYESIISRDYPVVMASLFFFSLLSLVSNLLSDLSLILMDPRISFKATGG